MARLRDSHGFTLIETMAAISVFAILVLGVTPLIASSLRGSSLARSFTVAKNLAQESLERMRGLPYFDSGANRDLLDLYFPNLGAGFDPATNRFTTTCSSTSSTPAPSADLACPPDHADGTSKIPAGYTVSFAAEFVSPTGSNPETFNVVQPPSGYSSADPALATPPAQLMRMTVTVTWTNLRARRFQLTSLYGNRKLSRDQARASATVDFVIQAFTSFRAGVPVRTSALRGTAGRSTSAIEIRNFARATIDSSGGEIRLVAQEEATTTNALDSVLGASASLSAPPTTSPAPAVTDTDIPVGSNTIEHPDLAAGQVAGLGQSQVDGSTLTITSPVIPAGVQVLNGLPRAASTFDFTGALGTEGFWANNQADTSSTAALKLDPTKRVLSVTKATESSRIKGQTYAEATAVSPSASRKAQAKASANAGTVALMPVTFLVGTQTSVIVIEEFQASIDCTSTGATGQVDGSWSAKIKYWKDDNPGDGLAIGHYEELTNQPAGQPKLVTGSVTAGLSDPLSVLGQSNNPLVFDAPLDINDIYLFDDPNVDLTLNKEGYLKLWDVTETIPSQVQGKLARVSMPQTINIVTARTDANNEETEMTIQVGKLSCQALDQR